MKKAIVVLLTLVLALVLVPTASTNPDNSTYDPMADVSRDGAIDIYDLARLAEAYGTTQTLPTQPNQTVVYVYQLETDPAEVQDARVAIVELPLDTANYNVFKVSYTNSSGIAVFTLNPNKNYTAIAWSRSAYNYVNFTTNSLGEASVIVRLGYPSLPAGWLVVTVLNKTTYTLVQKTLILVYMGGMYFDPLTGWGAEYTGTQKLDIGVAVWTYSGFNEPGSCGTITINDAGVFGPSSGYTPDENGTANVVIYI